jgi:hypothetical protein
VRTRPRAASATFGPPVGAAGADAGAAVVAIGLGAADVTATAIVAGTIGAARSGVGKVILNA